MNDWAEEYVEEAERRDEADKARRKKMMIREVGLVRGQLRKRFGRYSKEAKYIEKKIIPYIERMCYYPASYRSMVDGFGELIRFGKRVNRRIW